MQPEWFYGGFIGIVIGLVVGWLSGKSRFRVALDLPEYPTTNNVVVSPGGQASLTLEIKTVKDTVLQVFSDVIPDTDTPTERPQESLTGAEPHAEIVNPNTTKQITVTHSQLLTPGSYKFVVWSQVHAYNHKEKAFTVTGPGPGPGPGP